MASSSCFRCPFSSLKRTVLVLEQDTKRVEKLASAARERQEAAEAALYREWKNGKEVIQAKYIEYQNPVVRLLPKGMKQAKEVSFLSLSALDQNWIIAELKSQSENKMLSEIDRLRAGVHLASARCQQAMDKEGLSDAEVEMIAVYINRDHGKIIRSSMTAKVVTFTKTKEIKDWVAAENKYIAAREKGKPKGK
jgi:hypothetical protein